jgi:hypothetical protein
MQKDDIELLKTQVLNKFNAVLNRAISEQQKIMNDISSELGVNVTWYQKYYRYMFWITDQPPRFKYTQAYDLKFLGGRWKFFDPNKLKE